MVAPLSKCPSLLNHINTLLQEDIALEETADGIWSIYFYDILLARLDERDFKLYV